MPTTFFLKRPVAAEPPDPPPPPPPPGSTVFIDQAWLTANGPAPYYLESVGTTYVLTTDVTTDGTAFVIIKDNITFSLGGKTITFNNSTPIVVPNGSFEDGTGAAADNWDFNNAPHATRYAGVFIQNTLFDGTYSLRFNGHTGTEEVTSEGTITLEPNVTYSLSAVLGQRGYAAGLGLRVYVKLVGQNVAKEHSIQKASGNQMAYTDGTVVTGSTAETYKIVIGSDNPTGRAQYEGIIDLVRIQRRRCHGIVVGVTTGRLSAGEYPGVTKTGTPETCIIKNGTIVQGPDLAFEARGIYCYSVSSPEISNMNVTTGGANGSPLSAQYSRTAHVHHNTFTSNVRSLKSRSSFHASVVRFVQGSIHDNLVLGGCHVGIYSSAGKSQIYNNTVKTSSYYTNGNGILVNADLGSEIYNNLIDLTEGNASGRGMMIDRVNPDPLDGPTLVHDNTIIARELPRNQEYGGAVIGGCYGMQLEQTWYTHVYNNNITVYADEVEAHAFRMNNYARREADNSETLLAFHSKVYNNTFRAIRTSTAPYPVGGETPQEAFSCKIHSLNDGNDIEFRDNILISNYGWYGELNSNREQVFLRNKHVTQNVSDPTKFYPLQGRNYGSDVDAIAWRANRDIRIIDPDFGTVDDRQILENSLFHNQLALPGADENSWFFVSYNTLIDMGSENAGRTIVVKDGFGNVIYTLVLDANGQTTVLLDSFKRQGSTRTNYAYNTELVP